MTKSDLHIDFFEESLCDALEAPPQCYWVENPNGEPILLSSTPQRAEQAGGLYFNHEKEWEAVYMGWGTSNFRLRRNYELAECAAGALVHAVYEGPRSDSWEKPSTNWALYAHDLEKYPTGYFRWHEGITYEVVRKKIGQWHALIDGETAVDYSVFNREFMPCAFKTAREAMAYVDDRTIL